MTSSADQQQPPPKTYAGVASHSSQRTCIRRTAASAATSEIAEPDELHAATRSATAGRRHVDRPAE
jgi:hypothetical protein